MTVLVRDLPRRLAYRGVTSKNGGTNRNPATFPVQPKKSPTRETNEPSNSRDEQGAQESVATGGFVGRSNGEIRPSGRRHPVGKCRNRTYYVFTSLPSPRSTAGAGPPFDARHPTVTGRPSPVRYPAVPDVSFDTPRPSGRNTGGRGRRVGSSEARVPRTVTRARSRRPERSFVRARTGTQERASAGPTGRSVRPPGRNRRRGWWRRTAHSIWSRYSSADSSASRSPSSLGSTSSIQPSPNGSSLTSSGESNRSSFAAVTSPETGA